MKTLTQPIGKTSKLRQGIMAAVIFNALATGIALANDQDLVATTIPASTCAPANNVQAGLVHLSSGSWMFNTGATGGVIFNCPLPLNVFTVSDNTNDNDMTHFRVYYRDTDSLLNNAQVTARLIRRSMNGALTLIGPQWNSNNVNINVHTAQPQPVLHQMTANSLYSFQVTLARNNVLQNPMFTGIDFPNGSFIP